jgi:hypothetical protein
LEESNVVALLKVAMMPMVAPLVVHSGKSPWAIGVLRDRRDPAPLLARPLQKPWQNIEGESHKAVELCSSPLNQLVLPQYHLNAVWNQVTHHLWWLVGNCEAHNAVVAMLRLHDR